MLVLHLTTNDFSTMDIAGLLPERFVTQGREAVQQTPVLAGNKTVPIGEMFQVSGEPGDGHWRFQGDLSRVHRLGAGMTKGQIETYGSIGRHAGAEMTGGILRVEGNAGDWLGAQMHGGRIEIAGDAGHAVGAAYQGSDFGMRGGTIFVRGDAKDRLGQSMRRGWIVVGGGCGDFAGYRMRAGSIFVLGAWGRYPGAEMVRGTIGLFGRQRGTPSPPFLPTFHHACRITPPFLEVMRRELEASCFFNASDTLDWGKVDLYNGDFLTGGYGEILVATR